MNKIERISEIKLPYFNKRKKTICSYNIFFLSNISDFMAKKRFEIKTILFAKNNFVLNLQTIIIN